jgi:hypothetical protein
MGGGGVRAGGSNRKKGGMGFVDVALPALLVTANQSYNRKNSRLYRQSRKKSRRNRSNKSRRYR